MGIKDCRDSVSLLQNTHVALGCRRCHSPETQIYTDNQHLAHSRPEHGTAGTPLGSSLERDRQMDDSSRKEDKQVTALEL